MEQYGPLILAVGVAVALSFYRRRTRQRTKAIEEARAKWSLEHKLEVLQECGFALAEPFSLADLLESWDRAELEAPGFDLVLIGLGMTDKQEPWRNHCVNLWHLDTECIDGDGAYMRITKRMVEMAQGALPVTELNDHVDLEEGRAWVSFALDGRKIRYDVAVNDDWVDTAFLEKLNKLLQERDTSKLFVYYDLGGQDCVIGCTTRESFGRLKDHGVKFVELV